jgi:phytoene synthase
MTASNAVSTPPQPAFVCRRVDHDDGGGSMSGRELDAAGITEPALRESYERCRRLNASHGRTYYLATLLLPPAKRPYVHALYGLARYADELVDDLDAPDPAALLTWGKRLLDDLALGDSTDPIGRAAVHTARTWDIPLEHFDAFFASMRMDITRTGYATYADLERYMYGSAAVIGLQMLPLLEPLDASAAIYARRLGEAFQLSNFIRDVAEDLLRGRVYLPQEDLDAFGVARSDLGPGPVNARVRELLRFEIDRTRAIYRAAEPGIGLLHPSSRDCIRTAFRIYSSILDEVEQADYQVLRQRVRVPVRRRLAVAAPALLRARRARRVTPTAPRRPA